MPHVRRDRADTLDVHFLPDVDIECTDCRGSRYGAQASQIRRVG